MRYPKSYQNKIRYQFKPDDYNLFTNITHRGSAQHTKVSRDFIYNITILKYQYYNTIDSYFIRAEKIEYKILFQHDSIEYVNRIA